MALTVPETGRITLTLKADTIKALRLLALLKDESQNDVAEALLIAGGLHNSVDSEWSAGKPEQPKPAAAPPVQVSPTHLLAPTPAPIPQATPAPPRSGSPRDGQMPEIPKVVDESEVSPYMRGNW